MDREEYLLVSVRLVKSRLILTKRINQGDKTGPSLSEGGRLVLIGYMWWNTTTSSPLNVKY